MREIGWRRRALHKKVPLMVSSCLASLGSAFGHKFEHVGSRLSLPAASLVRVHLHPQGFPRTTPRLHVGGEVRA